MVGARLSVLLIPLVVTLACTFRGPPGSNDSDRFVPLNGGLVRTNTAYWEVRDFPYAGIRAELPIDVFYAADLPMRVSIMMHPVYPPRFALAEPTCLITIGLDRWDSEKRAVMRDVNLHTSTPERAPDAYELWAFSWHSEVSRFDEGAYSYFRLDVPCADDTSIRARAEVARQGEGSDATDDQDAEVIRRILTSLKCVDPKPVPKRGGGQQ